MLTLKKRRKKWKQHIPFEYQNDVSVECEERGFREAVEAFRTAFADHRFKIGDRHLCVFECGDQIAADLLREE